MAEPQVRDPEMKTKPVGSAVDLWIKQAKRPTSFGSSGHLAQRLPTSV